MLLNLLSAPGAAGQRGVGAEGVHGATVAGVAEAQQPPAEEPRVTDDPGARLHLLLQRPAPHGSRPGTLLQNVALAGPRSSRCLMLALDSVKHRQDAAHLLHTTMTYTGAIQACRALLLLVADMTWLSCLPGRRSGG